MSVYWLDWLSLLGRWLHLIAGIAWIGASFYFIWLDNHLVPPADPQLRAKGVGGELWAVHGGGFYNSHKYRVAPAALPPLLHWFYWEAYTTFLSGLFLLCLLYYGQAEVYLIDPSVAALSKPEAIALGAAFLPVGWLVYDGLCRALGGRDQTLGVVLAILLTLAAWVLCHLFSGRGAYMEFGAMLGTIMVANVFFVIIPGQRRMVQAKREGLEPDPKYGIAGKLRSTHNTYFTLPVLFVMISNHYAMTFAARYNWLVLVAICAAGTCIRLYFVARHRAHERQGRTSPVFAILAAVVLAGTAFALAPARSTSGVGSATFERAQSIVAQRCAPCHSAQPTQPGFAAPPNGVLLDTPAHILAHVGQMLPQVQTRAMPVGNLTGMTEQERAELLDWMQSDLEH